MRNSNWQRKTKTFLFCVQVSPKELEGIIKSLDSVADALVTGIPHPTDGYYPIAFVSIQKGEKVTAEEIINYVNGKNFTNYSFLFLNCPLSYPLRALLGKIIHSA